MTRFRLSAVLALLALPAGCVLFPTEPTRSVVADVRISTTGRGAEDSTRVEVGFISLDGGRSVSFRSDTLRVRNVIGTRLGGQRQAFGAGVPLDSAAVAQGVQVRLPVPSLGPVPHSEFTIFSAARRGSRSVTLRAGQDLQLSVVRGASGTLGAPEFERWNVSFTRGGQVISISGGGPLPSPIVIPWALIPREGAETMQVSAFSYRGFRYETAPGTSPRLLTAIIAEATLDWSVQIVP